ncbi:hypothetical protein [Methylibium sp.]|uniref:hypothetical protein n=1 Tax=Methylibium sp. TaxID=2067992 RepID=UPI003D0E7992
MSATRLADLGGALLVRPGRARPHNLVSTRPELTDMLTRGRPAAAVADILASLYSLCGHAHRLCARRAVAAASANVDTEPSDTGAALQQGTLREHLRRLWMDWPRQLAAAPRCAAFCDQALGQLQHCPAFAAPSFPAAPDQGEAIPGLLHWLQQTVLRMPPDQWLAAWERDPRAWLLAWGRQSEGWMAELLREIQSIGDSAVPSRNLRAHADAASLREIADSLRCVAAFTRQPQWRNECADTGPWSRLNQPAGMALDTPWLRLGARLAEAVRLALPDEPRRCGTQWLASGALALGPGEGLAWVEMARGLLVHHVQLDGEGDDARIAACRVLAPTEWNFHPQGALAFALERLPSRVTPEVRREVGVLMAAYDPCVPFEIEPARQEETAHA